MTRDIIPALILGFALSALVQAGVRGRAVMAGATRAWCRWSCTWSPRRPGAAVTGLLLPRSHCWPVRRVSPSSPGVCLAVVATTGALSAVVQLITPPVLGCLQAC